MLSWCENPDFAKTREGGDEKQVMLAWPDALGIGLIMPSSGGLYTCPVEPLMKEYGYNFYLKRKQSCALHSCQLSRIWRDSPEFLPAVPLLSRNFVAQLLASLCSTGQSTLLYMHDLTS